MFIMPPTHAAAVAHALTEARVLHAYVAFLSNSNNKPADVLVRQADRLRKALAVIEATKAEAESTSTHL